VTQLVRQRSRELLRTSEILLALWCAYGALADHIGRRDDGTCQVGSVTVSAGTMSDIGLTQLTKI